MTQTLADWLFFRVLVFLVGCLTVGAIVGAVVMSCRVAKWIASTFKEKPQP